MRAFIVSLILLCCLSCSTTKHIDKQLEKESKTMSIDSTAAQKVETNTTINQNDSSKTVIEEETITDFSVVKDSAGIKSLPTKQIHRKKTTKTETNSIKKSDNIIAQTNANKHTDINLDKSNTTITKDIKTTNWVNKYTISAFILLIVGAAFFIRLKFF
jgi:hypothetical protein